MLLLFHIQSFILESETFASFKEFSFGQQLKQPPIAVVVCTFYNEVLL